MVGAFSAAPFRGPFPSLILILILLLGSLTTTFSSSSSSSSSSTADEPKTTIGVLRAPPHRAPGYGFCERYAHSPGLGVRYETTTLPNGTVIRKATDSTLQPTQPTYTGLNGSAYVDQDVLSWPWTPWEPVNVATALTHIIMGLMGLCGSDRTDPLITFLWGLFVIEGCGSALFHWTLWILFAHFDSMPMMLMISIGMMIILDELMKRHTNFKVYRSRWVYWCLSKVVIGCGLSTLITSLIAVQALSFAYPKSISSSLGEFVLYGFSSVFALICVLVLAYARMDQRSTWAKFVPIDQLRRQGVPPQARLANVLAVRSTLIALVALGFQLMSEIACEGSEPAEYAEPGRYLWWGHMLWHLLVGYAVYLLCSLASWLRGVSCYGVDVEIGSWITPRCRYVAPCLVPQSMFKDPNKKRKKKNTATVAPTAGAAAAPTATARGKPGWAEDSSGGGACKGGEDNDTAAVPIVPSPAEEAIGAVAGSVGVNGLSRSNSVLETAQQTVYRLQYDELVQYVGMMADSPIRDHILGTLTAMAKKDDDRTTGATGEGGGGGGGSAAPPHTKKHAPRLADMKHRGAPASDDKSGNDKGDDSSPGDQAVRAATSIDTVDSFFEYDGVSTYMHEQNNRGGKPSWRERFLVWTIWWCPRVRWKHRDERDSHFDPSHLPHDLGVTSRTLIKFIDVGKAQAQRHGAAWKLMTPKGHNTKKRPSLPHEIFRFADSGAEEKAS